MSLTQAEPAHINFHFDPRCPFAWRTALWAREVRKVRQLEITWRFFSLAIANQPEGGSQDYVNGAGWAALRTLALVRRQSGNEGVEKLYIALGNAAHGRRENIGERAVVEACVKEAGFDSGLVEQALADESTKEDVLKDHEEAVKRYRAFGVPTLALEGSDIGFFGPVIHRVPTGEDAGELWDVTAWSLRNNNLYELKRDRASGFTHLEPVSAE
jgi:predicted DsbA family dithiol-disulfide isomerase